MSPLEPNVCGRNRAWGDDNRANQNGLAHPPRECYTAGMKTSDIDRLLGILRNPYWAGLDDTEHLHRVGSRQDVPMPTLGDLRGLVRMAQELAHVKTADALPPPRVFVWVRRKGQGGLQGRDRMCLVEQSDGTTRLEWAHDAIYPGQPVEEWSFFCQSNVEG